MIAPSALDELERLLSEQIERARREEVDAMPEALQRCDELIEKLAGEFRGGGASPSSQDQVDRIRELHQQLSLVLASKKSELTAHFQRTADGRRALKTYRQASSG